MDENINFTYSKKDGKKIIQNKYIYSSPSNKEKQLIEENKELNSYIDELKQDIEFLKEELKNSENIEENENIVPFFYNMNFQCKDNSTIIKNKFFKIKCWLLGSYPEYENLIMYPLGNNRLSRSNLLQFRDMDFKVTNEEGEIIDNIIGNLKLNAGKLTIVFEKCDFDSYPVLFQN